MANREITNPRLAASIKAMMVAIPLVLGVFSLGAFLAGIGRLPDVFGFMGVILLAFAIFFAAL